MFSRYYFWAVAALAAGSCTTVPQQRTAGADPAIPLTIDEQSDRPGQTFRDCVECPEMVVVPSGSFVMGAPEDEEGRFYIEGPQRTVNVRRLAVGKFHVTRGEWEAFVSATNRPTPSGCAWTGPGRAEVDPEGSWRNVRFEQDDRHPVVCVSWHDAQDYAGWLSKRTGRHYRLLTEAEWEYAARAGTTTAYHWGSTASHEYANYGSDKCCSPLVLGRDQWIATSPAGSFPANPFGLHDMHGNVLQWVQDCFASSYSGLTTDGSAYEMEVKLADDVPFPEMKGTSSCAYRMLRGGDWNNHPPLIRSAMRNLGPPPGSTLRDYRSGGVGFRVAASLK